MDDGGTGLAHLGGKSTPDELGRGTDLKYSHQRGDRGYCGGHSGEKKSATNRASFRRRTNFLQIVRSANERWEPAGQLVDLRGWRDCLSVFSVPRRNSFKPYHIVELANYF